MKRLVIGLIRFYQKAISPLKPASCRFYPTCSSYAIQAVSRFGILRGGLLAVWRILRCNPLCRGGVDPVPERFTFRRGRDKPAPGGTGERAQEGPTSRRRDGGDFG